MAQSKLEQGEQLQTFPQCMDCLTGLVETAAGFAAGDDQVLFEQAKAVAKEALIQSQASGLTSPEVANRIIREIKRITGSEDPYAEFKSSEHPNARGAYGRAKELLGSSLYDLVSLAALGNSIDFFMTPEESMAQVEEKARQGVWFQRNDIPRLDQALEERPGLVLYLADNTGEIYFDQPLFQYVAERSRRVVLVVKSGPALNDLTRAELKASGLAQDFAEVAETGSDGVGVEWDLVSPEFNRLVAGADLIISKGMANLETICTHPLPAPLFFIFQVKCEPMRDFLSAEPHAYWAMWREGSGP
jgi:uncharacterized protein with ATP-grasp and redox domains